MFLQLAHTKLEVFKTSKELVIACYQQTGGFPVLEKFGMVTQIRRAALSVILNIAEGSSRSSLAERKRFYEISRGSLIEIDTAFNVAVHLGYLNPKDLVSVGDLIIKSFKLLSKMISK